MKKTLPALLPLAIVLAGWGSPAAQVFYQFPDAAVVRAGEIAVGPYVAVGDHELYRFGGFARMNAARYFDVGFEVLLDSRDAEERAGVAGDVRFSVFPETNAIPFDLSLATGLGIVKSDDVRVFQIPLGGIISAPYRLDTGNILVPYLGVYVLFVDTKLERGAAPDLSDTDLDVEVRTGLAYALRSGPDVFAGVHVGRETMVTAGVSFWPLGFNRRPGRE